MDKYQFIRKKAFESLAKYEKRINEFANSGWRVVGMTTDHGEMTVLMERVRAN